ncbi:ubinuclein-1 [Aplochiton taeniatus]
MKIEVEPTTFKGEEIREKDELEAIAKKFEAKYGRENKRKKDRIQDLVDIGDGYDDEDSFIDNSEAYDEFVPASLTTKYGGFYVNSGPLQFRQASDTDTDEDFSTQRKKPKDPAGGGGLGLADPLLSLIGSTNESALLQAASTMDFVIDLDTLLDATVEDLELKSDPSGTQRKTQIQLQQPIGALEFAPQIQSKCQPQPVQETQLSSVSQPKINAPSTSLSQSLPRTKAKTQPVPIPSSQDQLLESTHALLQPLPQSDPKTSSLPPLAPLPEGLPSALERRIKDLTLAAKGSEGESKLKFFTPEINHILLDVELQCRELGIQVRSRVYTHLASLLPCSRDTLLKRVKKLLQAQKEPMQKLKEAVGKAMPEQISRYHDYCLAHSQARVAEEGKGKENAGSEEEGEEKSGKRVVGPRKKFKWNDEISVVQMKMERYEMEQGDNQGMEEYLKTFLDNEVKQVWPKGWMQLG